MLQDIGCNQSSRSVVSDSLRPHEPRHTRPPCPSPTPGVYPNSYPLSWWCHPTISSSVITFSCLQSFPASGSFPVSQFFTSGGQSIGVSASASVLPMNIPGWLPGECTQSPVNRPLCPEWWRSQYAGWKVQTFYSDIVTGITWKWGRVILRIRAGEKKKKKLWTVFIKTVLKTRVYFSVQVEAVRV